MGSDGWRYERGEGRVVLAHVEALVVEGLLGGHMLHVAVRVAMHLYAVGRWRHALVRLVAVLLRLGEGRCARLAVCAHAVVEGEAVGGLGHAVSAHVLLRGRRAMLVVVLGNLWSKVLEAR